VLLQQGKGAEIGAVFGSSEAIFGSAGPATLLSKITTVSAVVFMLTSLSLTYLSMHSKGGSVMQNVQETPAIPAAGVPLMPAVPEKGAEAKPAGNAQPTGKKPTAPAEKLNHQSSKAGPKASASTGAATKTQQKAAPPGKEPGAADKK